MDAFCLPSASLESFGNAAVEAMAMGVPSIVFADGGGMLEHIENGVTGMIANDQSDLERSLRLLDPGPRPGVGSLVSRGGNRCERRYTPDKAAQSLPAACTRPRWPAIETARAIRRRGPPDQRDCVAHRAAGSARPRTGATGGQCHAGARRRGAGSPTAGAAGPRLRDPRQSQVRASPNIRPRRLGFPRRWPS